MTATLNISLVEDDAAIVSAIVSLGQKLGLVLIAEDVEEQSQYDFLRNEGCDRVQGYYIARASRR